jgi:tetratricopeptide (TPR) repeat protein
MGTARERPPQTLAPSEAMKPLLLPLLVSSVVAAGVGAAVALALSERTQPRAETRAAEPAERGLEHELARLAQTQAELAARLDEERAAPRELAGLPPEAVAAAVERYLAQRPVEAAAAGAAPETALPADERRVKDALARLNSGELDEDQVQALWAEMGKAGLSDDLVAAYEARVEGDPNDPDLRVELGSAYLQKIFEVGNGPAAGLWAMKADAAFDAALELDPEHWDARFTKAVSLSFWPPALGKQNAAIEQYETLLEQQQGQPKEQRFAQTYLFLGNMYQQTGQAQKALATWQEGLALYPDSDELQSQVQLTQKQE